jgi:hypothetical protein
MDLTKTKYQWMYTARDDHEFLHFIESIADWGNEYWEIHDNQFDSETGTFPWTSACGLNVHFSAPGMFSRMGAMRCDSCCDAIGISRGKGSAINDDTCKIL